MTSQSLNGVLQHLRTVAAVQTYRELSDHELLERFVGAREEAAFTVLIERHGPMVLGVCRRALPHDHDAEDACQAAFLVLARKAASIRKKTALGSWLHGVACRVVVKLKRDHARRSSRERGVAAPAEKDPAAEVSWREVQTILDEELEHLPERYRVPLILCYLECRTRDQAAQQLGLSPGSLHGRLERARGLLRQRLTNRGLTLAAVLSAAALGESVAQAALPPTFVVSSTRAALQLAAGQPLTSSVVTTQVLALTQEVLKAMFATKLKLGTAAVLCAGLFAALIGGSLTSLGIAQDAKPLGPTALAVDPGFPVGKAESDADFIRRISKDLRGTEPTPAEVHFFVANKEPGRRQKLIDLFIQERQAKKGLGVMMADFDGDGFADVLITGGGPPRVYRNLGGGKFEDVSAAAGVHTAGLGALQKEFYKELHAAREKGDVAKITQAYLNRLIDYVKTNPKAPDVPDAIRQIIFLYESQGKTVEAGAWRDKLQKQHSKMFRNSDAGISGNIIQGDLLEAARFGDRVLKEQSEYMNQIKQAEKELIPPPSTDLNGVIEKIDPKDASLLSISIGSDAGLAKHHTLDVYRLKPAPVYLGKIEIIEVSPQKAVGRRVGNKAGALPLKVGDTVTSQPLTPAAPGKD
jgi:RNA polymerase sigma factor (sigma-70 family)